MPINFLFFFQILDAFYQFRFDPLSLDCFLREGMIVVVMQHLQQQLTSKNYKLVHEPVKENLRAHKKLKQKRQDEDESLPKPKVTPTILYQL